MLSRIDNFVDQHRVEIYQVLMIGLLSLWVNSFVQAVPATRTDENDSRWMGIGSCPSVAGTRWDGHGVSNANRNSPRKLIGGPYSSLPIAGSDRSSLCYPFALVASIFAESCDSTGGGR